MPLKIIFMGTPEFSVPILKSIHESTHKLLAIFTNSPKKKNRGQKIIKSPIHQYGEKLNIPIRMPDDINLDQEYKFIKDLKPDVVVVVAYGKIIPLRILNLPNIKFLNIHASILPQWRGAAPIQRDIMNRDKETGISIMKIEKELDAGPVMKISKINIHEDSTYESLSKKLSNLSASTIIESLEIIQNNKEDFVQQDNLKASYAKKIRKSESKINWKDKAKNIVAKINALNPNPGTWFEINGTRIKILKAIETNKRGKPGEILDEKFIIGCLENSIQILEIQKEGKKSMTVDNFLIGNKLKIGKSVDNV